jgi:hypothetical protein
MIQTIQATSNSHFAMQEAIAAQCGIGRRFHLQSALSQVSSHPTMHTRYCPAELTSFV